MTSPALLRAAAALQASEAWSSFWSEDDALVMATAVVRALREPDEAMALAAIEPLDPVIAAMAYADAAGHEWTGKTRSVLQDVWQAMIDEILA